MRFSLLSSLLFLFNFDVNCQTILRFGAVRHVFVCIHSVFLWFNDSDVTADDASSRSQTWVTKLTKCRGNIIIEPSRYLATTHFVSATNGVATVKKDAPFLLLLSSFVDINVRLNTIQMISYALPNSSYTVMTEECLENVLIVNLDETTTNGEQNQTIPPMRRSLPASIKAR